jgi:hypothetical protein
MLSGNALVVLLVCPSEAVSENQTGLPAKRNRMIAQAESYASQTSKPGPSRPDVCLHKLIVNKLTNTMGSPVPPPLPVGPLLPFDPPPHPYLLAFSCPNSARITCALALFLLMAIPPRAFIRSSSAAPCPRISPCKLS